MKDAFVITKKLGRTPKANFEIPKTETVKKPICIVVLGMLFWYSALQKLLIKIFTLGKLSYRYLFLH